MYSLPSCIVVCLVFGPSDGVRSNTLIWVSRKICKELTIALLVMKYHVNSKCNNDLGCVCVYKRTLAPFLKSTGAMSTPSISLSCGTCTPTRLKMVGRRSRVEESWRG